MQRLLVMRSNNHKLLKVFMDIRKNYNLRNFPYLFWDKQPWNALICRSIISEISYILKTPRSIVIKQLKEEGILKISKDVDLFGDLSTMKIGYIMFNKL